MYKRQQQTSVVCGRAVSSIWTHRRGLGCISQTDYGRRGESWETHRTYTGESPGITLMLPGQLQPPPGFPIRARLMVNGRKAAFPCCGSIRERGVPPRRYRANPSPRSSLAERKLTGAPVVSPRCAHRRARPGVFYRAMTSPERGAGLGRPKTLYRNSVGTLESHPGKVGHPPEASFA